MRGALVRAAPGVIGERALASPLPRERARRRSRLAAGGRAHWPRAVAAVAVLIAAVPVLAYIWLALHRVNYPYELDWLEGGTVELVGRVLGGHGLYSPPTLGYVGFTYTPLYSYLAGAVAEVTGLGFLPLRLVSFAASLVVIAVLGRYVARATADAVAGCVAGGLFAATYGLTGFFFDVGRLDSLFLALAVLALWLGRGATGVRGGALTGLVAFLAFFTKQTGLIVIVPALICAGFARPRAGVSALVVLLALVLGSTLVLDALTHGWYRYYVVNELAGHPENPQEWLGFWKRDLLRWLWPLAGLTVAALACTGGAAIRARWSATPRFGTGRFGTTRFGIPRPETARRALLAHTRALLASPRTYDAAAAGGLLISAWVSRLHTGGYVNVLMPAYVACAGIGGYAFARVRRIGGLASVMAAAVICLQIVPLLHHFTGAVPTARERRAGAALITRLRTLPGPVLVLRHPWYGTLAGKGTFAQSDGIFEVLRSSAPVGAPTLRRALNGALNRYHVQSVVLDVLPAPAWLATQLRADFVLTPGHPAAVRPVADLNSAPTYVYVRIAGPGQPRPASVGTPRPAPTGTPRPAPTGTPRSAPTGQ